MTAVGLLCDRRAAGLEEKPVDILRAPVPTGWIPRWRSITVEMAMTHRLDAAGCLDIDAADARSFGQDYLHYLMKVPLEANPGDVFRYTDAAFYLLSRVVEQRAGRHLDDFLWREILYPLGFREAAFSRCPLGHAVGRYRTLCAGFRHREARGALPGRRYLERKAPAVYQLG